MKKHVALNGFMGAGKTTIGKKLARRLGVRFFDLDELVVAEHGPIEIIFDRHGKAAFRQYELEALTRLVAEEEPAVIALGGGAVTNPPTLDVVKKQTYSIWLYLTVRETIARVKAAKRIRPLLGANPTPSHVAGLYTGRLSAYRQSDLTIDAGGKSTGQVVNAIVERLPKHVL